MPRFWRQEHGQDVVEYTLLPAFVAVVSAALLLMNGASIAGIRTVTNNDLSAARSPGRVITAAA